MVLEPCARGFVAAATGLLAIGGAGCAFDIGANDYVARDQKAFSVSVNTKPEIELATFRGSVEVRTWTRPEVRVEIEKSGPDRESVQAIAVNATQDGDRIRVEAVSAARGGWQVSLGKASPRARLIAMIPRASVLRVRSGDGSIRLEGIEGQVDVDTGEGSVRGIALTGDLKFRTGDGSIKLETIDGHVDADTGDGTIVLSGHLRSVLAHSGDGSISIRAAPGSQTERDWRISTRDGGIALEVPEGFGAEVDAQTDDGVVRTEKGLVIAASGAAEARHVLRARLGEGGRAITIRTGDGSISLQKR